MCKSGKEEEDERVKETKKLRFLLAFLQGLEVWRSSKANTKRGCNFPTLFSFCYVLVFHKCQHNITFLKWKLHFLCYFRVTAMQANKVSSILDKKVFIVSNHTIRKVKFLSKNSILTKPKIFTSFSPKIFLTIFSGNQSWIFGQKMKIWNSVFTCMAVTRK